MSYRFCFVKWHDITNVIWQNTIVKAQIATEVSQYSFEFQMFLIIFLVFFVVNCVVFVFWCSQTHVFQIWIILSFNPIQSSLLLYCCVLCVFFRILFQCQVRNTVRQHNCFSIFCVFCVCQYGTHLWWTCECSLLGGMLANGWRARRMPWLMHNGSTMHWSMHD